MQEINLLALLAVLVLPACGPQSKKNKKAAFQKAAFSMPSLQTHIDTEQSVVELEARLTDIPTLIGSRTISMYQISEQPQQLRLEIECDQSMAEVDSYYAEQMLYNGWQLVAHINDTQEIIQLYKKPNKLSIITIRGRSKSLVTVIIADAVLN